MTYPGEIEDIVRIEGGRMLAVLAASTGDLQLAEDAIQDAVVSALEVWPRLGVPANPAGWLYVAARRKAIDVVRRESDRDRRQQQAYALDQQLRREPPQPSRINDDVLRLIFTCCHPAIALDSSVALALRTLCGLSTADVARALLVSEPTMAKRLVRTKQKIARAAIPYRIPDAHELPARLEGVHAVIHLVYTAGHHGGDNVIRTDLCDEGIRLARLLVDLVPDQPSSEALLALLLLTDARRGTRIDDHGELVPMPNQDRRAWDQAMIAEGVALLNRSLRSTDGRADPYQLQASIAAFHSTSPSHDETDWAEIARLYTILAEVHPNPVVSLNAAVAVAEVDGPAVALLLLDDVDRSARSHLWHVARGELLLRLQRNDEAIAALTIARDEATTEIERRHLARRIISAGGAMGVDAAPVSDGRSDAS
ncbi:MAG: RNA polymerase sigma factor [Acidimicrobiia bacterium]